MHRWLAISFGLLSCAAGCSSPLRVVPLAVRPAETGKGDKATGEVAFLALKGDEQASLSGAHAGTLAQSGEGSLGDRLFREDEYGFVEACRYVAKGRVCDLITLDDGTHLGGGVHWIVPKGAAATPRAGGWVAQGMFLTPTNRVDRDGVAVRSLAPVLFGRAFHCRFTDTGAKCMPVPATSKTAGYTLLCTFSLEDGGVRREVLWVGIFGEVPQVGTVDPALGIKELHRCETTEDTDVRCQLVSMK
jgi:hypothetical protein